MSEASDSHNGAVWAVIFASVRTSGDDAAYGKAAQRMVELAKEQPGFLGVDSARGADDVGITVSYWSSREAINAWRQQAEHAATRAKGRSDWYSAYTLRVCRLEYGYDLDAIESPLATFDTT